MRRGMWSRAVGPRWRSRQAPISATSCKEYGHFKRDCPQQVQESRPKRGKKGKGKQGGGGSYQLKWCSEHNTTKQSDAECNKQKELRDKKQKLQRLAANLALLQQAGQANFFIIGSAHPAQSSLAQPSQPEPTTFGFSFIALSASLAEIVSSAAAGTPPAASDAKPAAPTSASSETPTQDHRLPHGFFGAFMATPAELSLAPFLSDGSFISMVVDSGATDNYVDPALTPGLRAYMRDVEELRVPHTIVAAG